MSRQLLVHNANLVGDILKRKLDGAATFPRGNISKFLSDAIGKNRATWLIYQSCLSKNELVH